MINVPNIWRTAYKVDFTALSALNIKTGGTVGSKIIDGKAWTWANDANAAAADVTPGTGVAISANSVSTNYNGTTRTCPILTVPVLTLFPAYSPQNHILRVMTRVLLTNSDTNFEFGGMSLEDASAPTNQNIHVLRGFNTTPERPQVEATVSGTTTIRIVDPPTTDTVLGILFRAPKVYEAWTGAYTSGQSLTLSTFKFAEFLDMAHPLMRTSASPTIGLFQVTLNGTASFTVTFTHLQLDYYAKNPP